MNNSAVKLTNVSKKYTLHHVKPTLIENIVRKKTQEEFWALRKINLIIKKGEKVGLIGSNGAGKTTLLKTIVGITTPTTGSVLTKGKVISLIELAAGFHWDLTGEENIILNGLILGMSKSEVKSKTKKIIKFAGIGKFIDSPFFTYSSGMALRLGFSIAVHADPDILILDENISIGDEDFKEKSFKKIQQFFNQGKTIILATHSIDYLKTKFNRIIWLDHGKIKQDGQSRKVIDHYLRR